MNLYESHVKARRASARSVSPHSGNNPTIPSSLFTVMATDGNCLSDDKSTSVGAS